jgi:hypothetical protein
MMLPVSTIFACLSMLFYSIAGFIHSYALMFLSSCEKFYVQFDLSSHMVVLVIELYRYAILRKPYHSHVFILKSFTCPYAMVYLQCAFWYLFLKLDWIHFLCTCYDIWCQLICPAYIFSRFKPWFFDAFSFHKIFVSRIERKQIILCLHFYIY